MGESKAVAAIRSAVEALNGGDIDGYLDHFNPSCRRWIVGVDQPLSLAEVSDGLRDLHAAFEGLQLEEDLLFGDDRFACVCWRMRGRHVDDYLGIAPSGRTIEVETCEIYELDQHLVVTTRTYGDLGQLFRQISVDESHCA